MKKLLLLGLLAITACSDPQPMTKWDYELVTCKTMIAPGFIFLSASAQGIQSNPNTPEVKVLDPRTCLRGHGQPYRNYRECDHKLVMAKLELNREQTNDYDVMCVLRERP